MLELDGAADGSSTIDVDRLPSLARARGLETTLVPGEVLWLPSFYWHFVRQLDEGQPNLSVNTWCGAQPDGSTIVGGRAKSWKHSALGEGASGTPRSQEQVIADLLSCSLGSFRGAVKLAAARTAAARDALEAADDLLLSGARDGAVWAEDDDAMWGLRTVTTGRWVETTAATRLQEAGLQDEGVSVGELLNAMAAGEDALTEAEALHEFGDGRLGVRPRERARMPAASGSMGPLGSPGHKVATTLRLDLVAEIGVEKACALLRVVTRHGRLHPGIAPKVEGPVINSEKWELTPEAELQRMLSSDGRAESPFL